MKYQKLLNVYTTMLKFVSVCVSKDYGQTESLPKLPLLLFIKYEVSNVQGCTVQFSASSSISEVHLRCMGTCKVSG